MVGFGSSLRMARRAGWEKAYLDYETLKLLLSQIEAVYEEEWHRQLDRKHKKRRRGDGDYRDFLFLESDSDVAFASEAELLKGFSDEEYSTDEEQGQSSLQGRPFTMSFSQEETASSGGDDDDDDSLDVDENCGTTLMSWRQKKSRQAVVEPSRSKSKRTGKRRPVLSPGRDAQSEFFVGDDSAARGQSSLLNTPLHQHSGYGSNEATALLQQPTLDHEEGSFYSFGKSGLTPPTDFSGNAFQPNPIAVGVSVHQTKPRAAIIPPRGSTMIPPAEAKRNKLEEERRRKRRQRRRRKQAKRRRELERRVPQHLRLAHAKARSITERFLGLLRAEVEKVTLFAQSRLGELADTAGSLRFPSCDDSEFGSFSNRPRGGRGGYDHPLSDGGMHPSASSSDDEHGTGIFPWSDSSDDDSEEGSRPGISSRARRTFSTGTGSSTTDQATNLAAKRQSAESYRNERMPSKSRNSAFDAAQRQISHFTAIRCEKPTFQRNDHIVGEDLLLLSAVDEVDGFTAVGVELMHILRFISVNVIAVRKICRKHDRLLMNRMLGGYYHRKRKQIVSGDTTKLRREQKQSLTLGSIVSRSLGEESEIDPAMLTGNNQNKLVGVYDLKVQELANAPTVQVVSSCLALALSEYEVTQSRADALSKLNSMTSRGETPRRTGAGGFGAAGLSPPTTTPFSLSPPRWLPTKPKTNLSPEYESLGVETPYDSEWNSDAEENAGPPSTTSSISLTRLRFTVVSIFALRESARFKLDYHNIFLCRSLLAFNGPSIVGEGLDGCSREVLDFLIAYNPDSALLLDSVTLYEGLQEGNWRTVPIGKVMLSCLSMAISSPMMIANKAMDVDGAVSIMPNLTVDMPFLEDGKASVDAPKQVGDEFNGALLELSRASCLLYSMNDYIIHATANSFVRFTGAHPAYSALPIGATSFAALFATGLHCYQLSNESLSRDLSAVTLRMSFVLAAVAAILGNVVYIVGVSRESIAICVTGRLLVGLASSDMFHRQIVTDCLPSMYIVPESARLVKWRLFGRIWGLLVGSLLGSFSLHVSKKLTIGAFQSSSYLMAFLWLVQAFRLFFLMPDSVETLRRGKLNGYDNEATTLLDAAPSSNSLSEEFSSDESETEQPTPESVLYHSSSTATRDELKEKFTAEKARVRLDDLSQHVVDQPRLCRRLRQLMKRLAKFLMYNIALPITVTLVILAKISHEIFFTSCPIITYRYFRWSGSLAAFFLGALSASAILINYVCGNSTRTYDERSVIKRALPLFGLGLLIMINYASLFSLAEQVENLLDEQDEDELTFVEVHPYDGVMGIFQYIIGFAVVYTAIVALEGASLSLMSKVSPPRLKSIVINCGTIVTFASLAARVLGDIQILFVGLSHRLINTDIVNSLAIPLLIACVAAYYIVKKHFFFLM